MDTESRRVIDNALIAVEESHTRLRICHDLMEQRRNRKAEFAQKYRELFRWYQKLEVKLDSYKPYA